MALEKSNSLPSWKKILRENFTKWKDLALFLGWDTPLAPQIPSHFPLNLPRRLAEKIDKNNPFDPILLQFLPSEEESAPSPGSLSCRNDPVGDLAAKKTPKLLHKYEGRALILATSACAMHCRYCFRQHYPYETVIKTYEEELEWLRQNPSIKEVILSGGDPLSLNNETLKVLIQALDAIPHLQLLRFHTRFPMGIPERIDEGFLQILSATRLQPVFIIHSNHPNEWDADIRAALRKIRQLSIPMLCQTVLLKGINDEVSTLKILCEELVHQGILPYYLNQFDPVTGGARFRVPIGEGKALVRELAKRVPGYALPRYMQEIEGEPHKTEILNLHSV